MSIICSYVICCPDALPPPNEISAKLKGNILFWPTAVQEHFIKVVIERNPNPNELKPDEPKEPRRMNKQRNEKRGIVISSLFLLQQQVLHSHGPA